MKSLKKLLKNIVKRKVLQKMQKNPVSTNYSEADYDRNYRIWGHSYVMSMIAEMFETRKLNKIFRIVSIICIAYLIYSMISGTAISDFGMLCILAVIILDIVFIVLIRLRVYTEELVYDILRKIWLTRLNQEVITTKDWKKIEAKIPGIDQTIKKWKSCTAEVYECTYYVANCLQNPELKILWIAMDLFPDFRTGNAVLLKGDKVFDPFLERTYSYKEYSTLLNIEVFKEYSLEQYKNEYESFFKYNNEGILEGELAEFISWLFDQGVDLNWFRVNNKTIQINLDCEGNRIVEIPTYKQYRI